MQAVRDAPRLVLITLFILIAAELVKIALPANDPGAKALRTLIDLIRCVLMLPASIGLYRLLLLAEKPAGYSFDWGSLRFRRFLIWSLVFELTAAPFSLLGADSSGSIPEGAVAIALLVIFVVGIYLGLRLILLLPALAAGSEDVSWRDAWADTLGRVLRILKILLGSSVLFIAIVVPATIAVEYAGFESDIADLSNWRAWARAIFDGAMTMAIELPMLAAGALLFNWIGDRVKRDVMTNP